MSEPDLPAIVAIVEDGLDRLAAIASPVDSGVALVTAGLSEISAGEDVAEVLGAYRDTLHVVMAAIAARGVGAGPVVH
jgi:hypothetical protein